MNQAKKLEVYMDFLQSNPNLRFQKKNSKPPGPGDFNVKKMDSYQ